MKVIVLGGAGHIGACGVRELVKRAPNVEVVIADKNLEVAEKLASEVGGKTSAKPVDADKPESLVGVIKDADVVLSTIGPYFRYGERVVRAAIDAKVNLIDINDDWDATRSCLNLDEEAKRVEITVIIGLGATPGITNIMAKYGANRLDKVNEIHTAWAWTALDPKMTGTAIVEHYFHAVTGEVDTYRDGKWVKVLANSEPEVIEFVSPIGKQTVCHVGHPEPITIPRYIKDVKVVCNKGGIWPERFAEIAGVFIRMGLSSLREITIDGIKLPVRSLASKLTLMLPELAPELVWSLVTETVEKYGEFGLEGVVLRTEVRGEKRGKLVRYSYGCGAQADLITALPAVIGVLMLIQGQIKEKGVFAPEGIIDPEVFLKELTKDIPVEETKVEPIS